MWRYHTAPIRAPSVSAGGAGSRPGGQGRARTCAPLRGWAAPRRPGGAGSAGWLPSWSSRHARAPPTVGSAHRFPDPPPAFRPGVPGPLGIRAGYGWPSLRVGRPGTRARSAQRCRALRGRIPSADGGLSSRADGLEVGRWSRRRSVAARGSSLSSRASSIQLPAALLLEGEPGIGKTVLWGAGLELAGERGFRVLAAVPATAETRPSFAWRPARAGAGRAAAGAAGAAARRARGGCCWRSRAVRDLVSVSQPGEVGFGEAVDNPGDAGALEVDLRHAGGVVELQPGLPVLLS
jgi:hypothetical protein